MGFDPLCPKTRLGNGLALRAQTLIYVAHMLGLPRILEQPWASMMRSFNAWKRLVQKERVSVVRSDSPRQKTFRFLASFVNLRPLARRCFRDHSRLIVEGKYTKASASAILERRGAFLANDTVKAAGLEKQLVSLVPSASSWEEVESWRFRCPCHTNLLKMKSFLKLAGRMMQTPYVSQGCDFVDSNVI